MSEIKMADDTERALPGILEQYFAPQANGETIVYLNMRSCKFIVSSDRSDVAIYCGKHVAVRSYCAEHAAICYQPLKSQSFYKHRV